jgi:hypothetical protein
MWTSTALLGAACLVARAQTARAGINTWTSLGPDGVVVADLAIDPANPSTVYAGTNAGVFKSTNSGASWNNLLGGNVQALAIDPVTPTTLYAFSENLQKSTNGGASWTVLDSDSELHLDVCAMKLVDSTLFIGDCYSGLFRITDGGRVTEVGGAFAGVGVNAMVFEPRVGFFVGTRNGIYGTQRTFLSDCTALAIDPVTATVYAAGFNRVYMSTDFGGIWNDMGFSGDHIQALAVDPYGVVYVGTQSSGVFRATNGSDTWSAFNTGLTNTDIRALAFEPTAKNTLYAATASGVFSIQPDAVCSDGCTTQTPTETPTRTPVISTPTPTSTVPQLPVCIGDCSGTSSVAINDLIMLVNIALDNTRVSGCPHGVSSGTEVDVAVIIQAVNNALNGCDG